MKRTILNGLAFKVWSPSLYELEAKNDGSDISQVAVTFCVDSRWWIIVLMRSGRSVSRGPFRSRDEAIRLIAGRVEAVKNWSA